MNVDIVQHLSLSYYMYKKILLSSPGLTRSNIEEIPGTRTRGASKVLARGTVKRRQMTPIFSTVTVLNRPVQRAGGWEGTHKGNNEMGET